MNHKILFLLHLPPPVHGSSVIGLQIKESQAIQQSFECQFINLLASKNVAESGKISATKLFDFVWTVSKLIKVLLFGRPDICYFALTSTGIGFYKDVFLVALMKILRAKIIYHLHNKGVEKFSQTALNRLLYQFVFRDTKVILLSERLYPDIAQFVDKNQYVVCPNGLPDQIKPNENHVKDKTTIQILFLSNLIESKGVCVLIDALDVLAKRNVEFNCVFVGGEGDINQEGLNELISSKQLDNNTRYLGKKYGRDKEAILDNSDIFVLPTFYSNETFGLVLLEAMQHSLPVISTFEGGIPDIVQDGINGFLVPQKDVLALADRLEILIKNKELRTQFGVAGRKIYEENYTLSHFEQRLVSILSSAIDE